MRRKTAILASIRLVRVVGSCLTAIVNFGVLHVIDFLGRRQRNSSRNCGIALASLIENLGGAFLKLGQLLASRPDLLNQHVRTGLARLHKKIKPLSRQQIDKIFGERKLNLTFRALDPVPIASGTIAQVHIAKLHDGRTVAVKLRRPDINALFETDLLIARSVVALLSKAPMFKNVPLMESFDVISQMLLAQLNFRREAELTCTFKNCFLNSPMIIVPEIFFEHCTEDMIVMEYCDDLLTLDRSHLPRNLWEDAATRCLGVLYQMIFIDGLIHGDLHPGNLFCRHDGKIVVLDFGISGQMEAEEHKAFVDFFLGFVRGRGKNCAEVTLRVAKQFPVGINRAKFANDMQALVTEHIGKTVETFQVGRFLLHMFEIQRKYGIRSTTGFILPISSLIMLEGTLKELHPQLDFQTQALRFLFAAVLTKVECHAS